MRRRTFIQLAGTGLVRIPGAAQDKIIPADKKLDPRWMEALLARGRRRPYRGRELHTLGMPCGGICAGQLYVRGDGTLAHWWIANNSYNTGYGIYDRVTTSCGTYPQGYATYMPVSPVEQGFAIQTGGEARQLSRAGFDDIRFWGEYPVATIEYRDSRRPLPVDVRAEFFSPYIPLNTRDSAIPATVMRFTVTNSSPKPIEASLGGWLQNPVLMGLRGRMAAENVRAIHERYDGVRHNPWSEIECGEHYARALASWGCLLSASGFVYDGPAGRIGFAPRIGPDNFKAFFSAAEGWGSLEQERTRDSQRNRITVAWGRVRMETLLFELPADSRFPTATVRANGTVRGAKAVQDGLRLRISLDRPFVAERGQSIEVTIAHSR